MSSRAIHTIETRPNHRPVPMWEVSVLDEPSIELLPLDEADEVNETLEQALIVGAVTLIIATLLTLLSGVLGFLLGVLVAS
ncbi:MAG: hypothetical protein H6738_01975 [Alphaproteobacteria bacterium]|nr:hypothetical protein [Alphaproteobacteria bacterium]MCB9695536.1 hypothetical protein [Alphaproteobacteria bacterium]